MCGALLRMSRFKIDVYKRQLEHRGFEQLNAIKDNDHIIEAVQDSIENQELQPPV